MAVGSFFRDEAAQCDVAFYGPPCNNISRLNHFRDSSSRMRDCLQTQWT